MRLFLFVALFALICLTTTNCQDFTTPSPNRPGLFSKMFSWFKKPDPHQANAVADPLTQQDFDSSLPRESTDRMISDAISDRLLQESRPQQVIVGSPFIAQMQPEDKQSNESQQVASVAGTKNRDGYGKSVANGPTNTIPITEALRIVNTANLTDCVARVICELSCNANSYKDPGRAVFRNIIKLQFDQNLNSDDAKFFRQAASKGRQIVQGKRNCDECYTIYPSCKTSSNDLIAVSSMFKL